MVDDIELCVCKDDGDDDKLGSVLCNEVDDVNKFLKFYLVSTVLLSNNWAAR